MVECHFTPQQIDGFYLTEIWEIFKLWKREPPVRALVAAYLGFKPPTELKTVAEAMEDREVRAVVGKPVKLENLPPEIRNSHKEMSPMRKRAMELAKLAEKGA